MRERRFGGRHGPWFWFWGIEMWCWWVRLWWIWGLGGWNYGFGMLVVVVEVGFDMWLSSIGNWLEVGENGLR